MNTKQLPPVAYADNWISANMLAFRLQIGPRSVWRFVNRGLLPRPIRLGKKLTRWRWLDVVNHVAALHRRQQQAEGAEVAGRSLAAC